MSWLTIPSTLGPSLERTRRFYQPARDYVEAGRPADDEEDRMSDEVRYSSALALAAAIRAREISPLEAMEAYLRRAAALDGQLNAFALRDDDRALADAAIATEAVVAAGDPEALPPFFGVPIPIKDLEDVAGWPTTYGSWAASPDPVGADGPIAARLRAAGFVLMGKTTTPEFGTVSFTESDRLGVTRNPWDTSRTPGGSSGGAAAAVAAGMAPIAHGSDGAGSIRIPSACCGLVGLKPGRHRVTGDVELNGGCITSGVLTRTFAEEPGRDPGRLRIRVCLESPVGVPLEPAVEAATRRAAATLESLGHDVEVAPPLWPDPAALYAAFLVVWGTDVVLLPLAEPDRVEPHDRRPDPPPSAFDYAAALRDLQVGTRTLAAQFGPDFDLLVTPTMAVEPPEVGSWLRGVPEDDPGQAIVNCLPMGSFTAPFNLTGLPAMSVPYEVGGSGLPFGLQLVGGPWQEGTLLRLAAQLESELGWVDRRPGIVEG
jgi:amidase